MLSSSSLGLPPSAEPCSPPAVTSPVVTMRTQHSIGAGIFRGCNKAIKVVNTCNKPCPSNGQLNESYNSY